MKVLSRIDPTVKLTATVAISLVLIFVIERVTALLFLAVAIAASLAGGARPVTIARALVPLSLLGIGFVWSNAVFAATREPPTWTIGPFHATEAGLRFGLAIALPGLARGVFSLAVVWTTHPAHLVVGLFRHARL